jgi:hypothetical protein
MVLPVSSCCRKADVMAKSYSGFWAASRANPAKKRTTVAVATVDERAGNRIADLLSDHNDGARFKRERGADRRSRETIAGMNETDPSRCSRITLWR